MSLRAARSAPAFGREEGDLFCACPRAYALGYKCFARSAGSNSGNSTAFFIRGQYWSSSFMRENSRKRGVAVRSTMIKPRKERTKKLTADCEVKPISSPNSYLTRTICAVGSFVFGPLPTQHQELSHEGVRGLPLPKQKADIPESFFEYTAHFEGGLVEAWSIPNRFVAGLYSWLKSLNVNASDITFGRESNSLKDAQLTIMIHKLNALIKIGIETVTFGAANPDWSDADVLLEVFSTAMAKIDEVAKAPLTSQEVALAFHLKPGDEPFKTSMSRFVNAEVLGDAEMYGISVYSQDASYLIDKSVRYPDSLFIRLYRKFGPKSEFKEIAAALFADESRVLGQLGFEDF